MMTAPFKRINDIKETQLTEFFNDNESRLRPWQSDEWEKNREDTLNEHCEWCGEDDETLQIHHTTNSPRWHTEWMKAANAAFAASTDFDSTLVSEREECPECELCSFYERKTKQPTYRCNNCENEFSNPVTLTGSQVAQDYTVETKRYANDGYYEALAKWVKQNESAVYAEFESRFSTLMQEYISMEDVVTICQSCHFKEEQTSLQRCSNCDEEFHKRSNEMCWDCLVEKKGLVECDCGDGWYQESKYDSCSDCR